MALLEEEVACPREIEALWASPEWLGKSVPGELEVSVELTANRTHK